jgi:DNA-binding transcriptional LysR family regulator
MRKRTVALKYRLALISMPACYVPVRMQEGYRHDRNSAFRNRARNRCGAAEPEPASMELHQIRYFLALCEELHFTRAAERCAVAQSSLTRAIKALERELGGELFHRERANTHLTCLGERVKPSLEQVWRHVQAAQEQARQQGSSLPLGLMQTVDPAPPVAPIAALRARHPEIARQISQASAQTLRDQLLSILDALLLAPSSSEPAPVAAKPHERVEAGANHSPLLSTSVLSDTLAPVS